MPELNNNFIKGRMNKDLDERLVANGEYRDALNIEVSTSEGSNVGTVQTVKGNKQVNTVSIGAGFTCVGSAADEKNDALYWFVTSSAKDVILKYHFDVATNSYITTPVFVDTAKNAALSTEERQIAIDKLNKDYPEFLGNINLEKVVDITY